MNKAPKDTSLYETLEVAPTAELGEIKKAYRRLALIWHPDKWVNASEKEKQHAEAKFKEISKANSILSDQNKRSEYDRFGLDAVENGGHGREMTEEEMQEMFESMGMNFGDIGMGGFGIPGFGRRKQQKREPTIPHIKHTVNLNLKDIYLGSKIEFEITRYNLKKDADPKKEDMVCSDCKGVGSRIRMRNMGGGMMQQSEQPCSKCNGEGMIFSDEFFDKKTQKFAKNMPPGVVNGERINIENKGHEIPPCFKDKFSTEGNSRPNNDRTNIILVINEQREFTFENCKYIRGVNRNPYDIALELDIDPHEAICGTYKNVPFINGKDVCIKIPPGFAFKQGSRAVVVPKMGMPVYKQKNKYGDLYVILKIKDTFKLDDAKLKQIWKIFTGKDMTAENDKVIKKTGGEFIEAMTIDEFTKENNLNGNNYDPHDNEDNEDVDDNGGFSGFQAFNGGSQPQCAQQ